MVSLPEVLIAAGISALLSTMSRIAVLAFTWNQNPLGWYEVAWELLKAAGWGAVAGVTGLLVASWVAGATGLAVSSTLSSSSAVIFGSTTGAITNSIVELLDILLEMILNGKTITFSDFSGRIFQAALTGAVVGGIAGYIQWRGLYESSEASLSGVEPEPLSRPLKFKAVVLTRDVIEKVSRKATVGIYAIDILTSAFLESIG